jgi:hypothetical protein
MAIIFDEILGKGIRAGQIPAKEQQARNWYRDTAGKFNTVNEKNLLKQEPDRLRSQPQIGSMYMFYYDAKHKATLPYFDRFPMVFPYKKVKGGFMGLNLHYLPHLYRAKIMDALYDVTSNDKFDETTKLQISYSILENASKFRYFEPCVKHYLTSQLRSRFLYIYPAEWDIALFLPLERFQGATKSRVWKDSKNIIGR